MKGTIQYRGYDISDIVKNNKKFIDTAHLLIWGHWPSPKESEKLQNKLFLAMHLEQNVFDVIRSFP